MLGFLMGVAVGAAGFWAYKFWKGEDSSWDDSFSSFGSGSDSLSGSGQQPVGGSSNVGALGGSGGSASGGSTSGAGQGSMTTPE